MNVKTKKESIGKLNAKKLSPKQINSLKGGQKNAIVEEWAEGI